MSTVPQVGYIGEQLDLLVRQGATFGPLRFQMKSPDGSVLPEAADPPIPEASWQPVNLTGCTIRGQIRKKPSDVDPVATFTVDITAPLEGRYQIGLSAAQTAAIDTGATLAAPGSAFVWDLELEDSLGRVIPLYFGDVRVFREVTRA